MTSALVPLKIDSRRLPNKNFLYLGDKPLALYIFETLLSMPEFDNVYCYTSNPSIMRLLPTSVKLLFRPKYLDADDIKAKQLFDYAVQHIDDSVITICHATGPFVSPQSILSGLDSVLSGNFDSAIAVQEHKTYSWFKERPLNYSLNNIPQTQDLDPVYTETSGFYVFRKENYLSYGSRVHGRVKLVPVTSYESIDIDEYSDFAAAQCFLNYRSALDSVRQQRAYLLTQLNLELSRLKHVAFDFDGVLIDSRPVMMKAWDECIRTFNLNASFDDYLIHLGKPFKQILQCLNIPESIHSQIADVYEKTALKHISSLTLFVGIRELLETLLKLELKISIVTSKSKHRTEATIATLFNGINFDAVISPEDVGYGRGKPNPDPLLLSCIKVGCSPSETIYVGDMRVDLECSKAASIAFVQAVWGYDEILEGCDLWFADPSQLEAAVLSMAMNQ